MSRFLDQIRKAKETREQAARQAAATPAPADAPAVVSETPVGPPSEASDTDLLYPAELDESVVLPRPLASASLERPVALAADAAADAPLIPEFAVGQAASPPEPSQPEAQTFAAEALSDGFLEPVTSPAAAPDREVPAVAAAAPSPVLEDFPELDALEQILQTPAAQPIVESEFEPAPEPEFEFGTDGFRPTTAEAQPAFPTPERTVHEPEPAPDATLQSALEPVPVPSPKPAPQPIPQPAPEPMPVPMPELAPEPALEAAPTPPPEPAAPQPALEPTPEPTPQPAVAVRARAASPVDLPAASFPAVASPVAAESEVPPPAPRAPVAEARPSPPAPAPRASASSPRVAPPPPTRSVAPVSRPAEPADSGRSRGPGRISAEGLFPPELEEPTQSHAALADMADEKDDPEKSFIGALGGEPSPIRVTRRTRRSRSEIPVPGPEADMAFVGRIPRVALRPDKRVLSFYDPQNHVCEEYRLLGKNLLHTLAATAGDPKLGKVVTLSSSARGEGKTLTSVNLANTLSQDLRDRVLLIDADMRHPRVSRYLGLPVSHGLNDLLASDNPSAILEDCLLRTDTGLHLLASAPHGENPAPLLDSPRMVRLLDLLRQHYSLVIVDTPPVLLATDALTLGVRSDGMLLLLRARKTQREQVQEARQRIARLEIRMLGYVINNVRSFLPRIWRKYYNYNY